MASYTLRHTGHNINNNDNKFDNRDSFNRRRVTQSTLSDGCLWTLPNPVVKFTEQQQSKNSQHTNSPDDNIRALAKKLRGLQVRPSIDPETFLAPDSPGQYEPKNPCPSPASSCHEVTSPDHRKENEHPLVKAARNCSLLDESFLDQKAQEQVYLDHQAQNYQWVLSLPGATHSNSDPEGRHHIKDDDCSTTDLAAQGEKRHFFCNLISYKTHSKLTEPGHTEDRYLLLATQVDKEPDLQTTNKVKLTAEEFDGLHARYLMEKSPDSEGQLSEWTNPDISHVSVDSTYGSETDRVPSDANTRIEDSFEALDKFEEDFEALSMAAQVSPPVSRGRDAYETRAPSSAPRAMAAANSTPVTAKNVASSPATVRTKIDKLTRRDGTPSSVPESDQEKKNATRTTPPKRTPVARPASLAPPKPLQKAAKPPTRPAFELPGERVARELKEKKAARLSIQVSPEKVTAALTPPRSRSVRSKPPTRPNFELPGEAISRRKKEAHLAKLKAEEEEERKRRAFKAKPIRSSTGAFVRETATSRARTTKTGQTPPTAATMPASVAKKRQSMMASSPHTRIVSDTPSIESAARGRPSMAESPNTTQANRGRSSDDAQQQKMSTVETYQDRERAKLERQQSVKLARQKYGEQSRMLSREKAERKRLSTVSGNGTARASPGSPERYGLSTNY